MESIFVVQEERESSPLCKVVGVWKNKKDAEIAVMDLVKNNGLYNENSNIALDVGKGQILRSTPNTAPLICGACNTQPEGLSTMA